MRDPSALFHDHGHYTRYSDCVVAYRVLAWLDYERLVPRK
jgi:hypothetical protein